MKQESLASTTPPRRTPPCGNNTSSTYLGTILVFGWVNPSSGKLEKPAFIINDNPTPELEMCA